MRSRAFAFVAVIILLLAGVNALHAGWGEAVEESGDLQTVTNESWTVDQGNVTKLNDSNRFDAVYESDVTVYNASDVEISADGNFTWFQSNGSIRAATGSTFLADGSTAKITYEYHNETDDQTAVKELTTLPFRWSDVVTLALGVGLFVATFIIIKEAK